MRNHPRIDGFFGVLEVIVMMLEGAYDWMSVRVSAFIGKLRGKSNQS